MLLATALLFYVSYWLLSKIEVAKWSAFVKGRMEDALSTGSAFALSSVAFLAVYREGFETILFYKALLTSATGAGTAAVLAGVVVASIALVGVFVAIDRKSTRLNSSHLVISYAVFCLKKKKTYPKSPHATRGYRGQQRTS